MCTHFMRMAKTREPRLNVYTFDEHEETLGCMLG